MCSGKDILKVVGIGAAIYTGGAAAGLWGGASAAGGTALAGSALAGEAASLGVGSLYGGAAAAAEAGTGATVLSALKTGAQLAPLASLAASLGANPLQEAQGVPSPTKPAQAASTPAPNIFKKKLQALGDPTKVSGVGGVTDLSLGKATVLGS